MPVEMVYQVPDGQAQGEQVVLEFWHRCQIWLGCHALCHRVSLVEETLCSATQVELSETRGLRAAQTTNGSETGHGGVHLSWSFHFGTPGCD